MIKVKCSKKHWPIYYLYNCGIITYRHEDGQIKSEANKRVCKRRKVRLLAASPKIPFQFWRSISCDQPVTLQIWRHVYTDCSVAVCSLYILLSNVRKVCLTSDNLKILTRWENKSVWVTGQMIILVQLTLNLVQCKRTQPAVGNGRFSAFCFF